jgi:hypothetical protein
MTDRGLPAAAGGQASTLSREPLRRTRHVHRGAAGLTRPVILGRFIRLNAVSRRPERRSDDGQTILEMFQTDHNMSLDLLICGAPYGIEP